MHVRRRCAICMKNIIIAAGYATRLYPLTENFPKPLLEIGGSTILGRILDDVDTFPEIDEHVIVTNHKFAHIFEDWKAKQSYRKPITIIDDGTSTNETRLGAVKDLLLAIETRNIDDDILVLAADNILDFSFRGFIDFFKEKKTSCIMCHEQPELKKLQRTGVVVLDENNKVLNMEEKPEHPKSHWAVPPFYIYSRKDVQLIIQNSKFLTQHFVDAPGNLAHYMCDKVSMHAWQMPGARFDIGSLDTYEEAKRRYSKNNP